MIGVSYMRRLPVYILLDTSGSMSGEPIEALKNGLKILISTLNQDPYALETAYLSIITFADYATQEIPLTELSDISIPSNIRAYGCTALGKALSCVSKCIQNEVKTGSAEAKGDWKPLVFIMSDGEPTDNICNGLEEFKKIKKGIVVACAAGENANTDVLKSITENVVSLNTIDTDTMKAFFKWVSASVAASSVKVEDQGSEASSLDDLPPPPDEINIVP